MNEEYDIANIDRGDAWLTTFLKDEDYFIRRLRESMPLRFCLTDIYGTLIRVGAAPNWIEQKSNPLFLEAVRQAKEWWPEATESQNISMAKCIFVLNHLSEKRLTTTAGNG